MKVTLTLTPTSFRFFSPLTFLLLCLSSIHTKFLCKSANFLPSSPPTFTLRASKLSTQHKTPPLLHPALLTPLFTKCSAVCDVTKSTDIPLLVGQSGLAVSPVVIRHGTPVFGVWEAEERNGLESLFRLPHLLGEPL